MLYLLRFRKGKGDFDIPEFGNHSIIYEKIHSPAQCPP
jgi:hypothetical protein